jgi:hypothetical protein
LVLMVVLGTEVLAPPAGLLSTAPSPIAAHRSGCALDLQPVKTNPVGGAVVVADSPALSLSVR